MDASSSSPTVATADGAGMGDGGLMPAAAVPALRVTASHLWVCCRPHRRPGDPLDLLSERGGAHRSAEDDVEGGGLSSTFRMAVVAVEGRA